MIMFLKKYSVIGKWLFIIFFIGFVTFSIYDYGQSKEQLKTVISDNKDLEYRITNIKKEVDTKLKTLNELRQSYQDIELKYNQSMKEISELKSLTNDYIKSHKPQIETDINQKFQLIMDQYQCSSGDISKCVISK